MIVEYGAGVAGVFWDGRRQQFVGVGPDTDLVAEGYPDARQYYRSQSGLSGAWRLPRRPYLHRVCSYRSFSSEVPSLDHLVRAGTPWVGVNREGIDPDLPIVVDACPVARDTAGPGNVVQLAMCEPYGDGCFGSDPFDGDPSYRADMSARRTDGTWVDLVVEVYAPPGTRSRYKWHRVAWQIARKYWAESGLCERPLDAPSLRPVGVDHCNDLRVDVADIVRDSRDPECFCVLRDGFVTETMRANALAEWLASEPEHAGIGLLRTDVCDDPAAGNIVRRTRPDEDDPDYPYPVIVDSAGTCWRFHPTLRVGESLGFFEELPGRVDWYRRTVVEAD